MLHTSFDRFKSQRRINIPLTTAYFSLGATGFDMVSPIRRAGRGLLATLNRGNVNLIGKNNTQSAPALAMAA